jgi:hypothetical protein
VRLLHAAEGARIGCKLSSFAFALTVQDMYESISGVIARFKDGSCIKTATDDVVVVLRANEEKELSAKVNTVCKLLVEGGAKVGLSFSNDKALLLLPKDMSLSCADIFPPGIALRSNTFEESKLRGIEIVGAPIGSPDFCAAFVRKTLAKMLHQSESLLKLHPQSATKLLRDCVSLAPSYLAQVCHPNLTKDHLVKFDDSVWNLWLRVIGGTGGDELAACSVAIERAREKAFLPSRYDGVGFSSWQRTASFAWFTSVASCIGLLDRDLDFARRFLKQPSADAYEFALDALGGPSYLAESKFEIIPVHEPEVLSDSTFYKDLFIDNPKLKLQHEFSDLASLRAHRDFVTTNREHHADTSDHILLRSITTPGISVLPRLFTAKLTQHAARLTKTEFTIVARQYVLLPPLKNHVGEIVESKCGCETQLCANHACKSKEARLDWAGNHGLVCHPGVKAMRATQMEKALEKGFRAAGGSPTTQPATYGLLNGIFSKNDLSSLFAGRLNQTEAEARKKLAMKYLDILEEVPRGQQRTSELGMLRESFPPPSVDGEDDNNGIIRFDLKLPLATPVDRPREIWLDHVIVQETAPTYAEATLKFLDDKVTNLPEDSPAFQKSRGAKVLRYSALIAVVQRLVEERKLNFQPSFLFPIISSLGFVNKDMTQVLKLTVQRFVDQLKSRPPSYDGISAAVLKGRFKVELKDRICFALARGNALSVHNQGVHGGVVKPP